MTFVSVSPDIGPGQFRAIHITICTYQEWLPSRHFYFESASLILISGRGRPACCVAQLKSITPVSHPHRPPRCRARFSQKEKSRWLGGRADCAECLLWKTLFSLSRTVPLHLRKVQIIKRELKAAAAGKKRCVSRSHHCHYTIMALCGALFRRF